MKTIAFYSYKGGVGRTLAVSHVAYWLSREGKSVFLLDMDLEAPGLHYKLEVYNRKITPTKGLVDFIGYFMREDKAASSIKEYTIPLNALENKMSPMWLMPAGDPFSQAYWKQLSEIEWKDFLYKGDKLGSLLFLELKALIERDYNPDFLLIDSRTGLTDLTGIGMNLLADDAVILAVNNHENIDGSRIVMEKLRLVEKLPFKEAKTKMHFVLTRIPEPKKRLDLDLEEKIKKDVLERLNAGSGLASGPLVEQVNLIHIDPEQALEERNRFMDREWNRHRIALDYDVLASKVSGIQGTASSRRFQEILLSYHTTFDKNAKMGFVRELMPLLTHNPDQEFTKGLLAAEVLKNYDLAIAAYSKCIGLEPQNANAFNNRGVAFLRLKKYESAFEDFENAIAKRPQFALAYTNRGHVYAEWKSFDKAQKDYCKAIEIDPKFTHAFVGMANLQTLLGEFSVAIEYCDHGLSIEPDNVYLLCAKGLAYQRWGDYPLSFDNYNKAIGLDADLAPAYNGRASTLYFLGKFESALDDAHKALELEPFFAHAHGTLAEIHSAKGNLNLFYESLEMALSLDPSVLEAIDENVKTTHQLDPKFQSLLKKYTPK